METFGNLLHDYRRRARLSQAELARRVGLDPSYVNRIERGERVAPSRAVVEDFARALGLLAEEADQLRLAAGYRPASPASLAELDPTLRLVAAILADREIPPTRLADFRELVERAARLARRTDDG